MKELEKINPTEFGLEVSQVETIEQAFLPKIQEREALVAIYDQLIKSELTPELCKEAKEVRLKLVKVRTGIADIHKTQKAFFLAAGRFVDAWKNKETLPVEQMEDRLSEIENYYINIEKAQKAQLQAERLLKVSKYTEYPANALGEMEQQVYDAYLQGLKVAYDAKIEAERKAEEERLAAIEAEKAERERIRVENERLKAEAERKEKELADERAKAEAERKALEEAARKEREAAEAILKAEQEKARIESEKAANEKAALEAELKAKANKEAAELKAKQEAEKQAKLEAEKAAKAPRKEKLTKWVESFQIPIFENDEVATNITSRFNSFKKWAESEITNI
jgi:colicin import membrane protein